MRQFIAQMPLHAMVIADTQVVTPYLLDIPIIKQDWATTRSSTQLTDPLIYEISWSERCNQ